MHSPILNIADIETIDLAERVSPIGAKIGAREPGYSLTVIACPPGSPDTAHQPIDTGRDEMRFLAVSTMAFPEICDYPVSGKLNAITGMRSDDFRHLARHGESLDYWDGEA